MDVCTIVQMMLMNIRTMLIANGTIIFINTKISGSNLKNEVLFYNT
jgi:hypothetical protein